MNTYNDDTQTNYTVPDTIEDARNGLKIAKEAFDRSPTYHTARAVQIAQRQFDGFIREARGTFFTFDGSKGIHDITPYEITVSALKEVAIRGKELTELYKGIEYAPTKYVLYFLNLAVNALKDVGETIDPNEITKINLHVDNAPVWLTGLVASNDTITSTVR